MSATKRILFVDDDPLLLQGLRRMLHPWRHEWEMEFVESGEQALSRLGDKPFNVVVSDMRMPGMNGVELLEQVKARHPQTVRIILSGHADQELILRSVSVAHQYLSKPCDPEALKNAVASATRLASTVQNDQLLRLVSQMERLPSLPAFYKELVGLLSNPEVSMDQVGEVIARDIAMTAQILKVVNSSFFGLRRQISSAAEAASYLGADILRSLVLSLNAFSQFQGAKAGGLCPEALWSHSLQVGLAAKLVAQAERTRVQMAEDSFVSGLLHDTGKLVLASYFPREYTLTCQAAVERGLAACQAERETFGCNHAEVGGYLLGLWGLPAQVVDAVNLHHAPSTSPLREFTPLTAVHVADALAHQIGLADQAGPGRPQVDTNYLAGLGLADRWPVWEAVVKRGF
ncbi:MAG: HDOD domain-containing protein [Verrucomicrobia bacterium]|nr:HDOD domain-containing protein [Verrucomicrobiota bacterium]